jgi:hypothetical protein
VAQPGRPAAIAGDGVDRGGQCCGRVGVDPHAIEPGTAARSRSARHRQLEQGGVTAALTDDVMAEAQRGTDQRAAHGVEQQADWTQVTRAQQSLVASLPALPRLRHRPLTNGTERGRSRHGMTADSVTKHWHSRNARRLVLAAWSKRPAAPGASTEQRGACHRSRRSSAPLRSPVGRSGTAPRSGRATGTVQASSVPAQPGRQRQERLRDMPTRRQQSADDQFQKREPRAFRAGLHDLKDPSAKGRWEAGLGGRFHGVCGCLFGFTPATWQPASRRYPRQKPSSIFKDRPD